MENEGPSKGQNRKILLGRAGEDYAAQLVARSGLKIIERNYRCPRGEMDLIALDKERTLVFVEVRTRSSGRAGWGEESVTAAKMKRMRLIANYYLLDRGYRDWPPLRFDLVALRWREQGEPESRWLQAIF
ncbi:MAG: YraN family protein [Peptococcaceae bacterium]|jgi:putative endonuclease|nr:YraN family protein [Peptococcaceae bacterium]